MHRPLAYLAAPFFNEIQRSGVRELEGLIDQSGYDCFSASRDGVVCSPRGPRAERRAAFEGNEQAMTNADVCFAWVDWLLPTSDEVRQIQLITNQIQVNFPEPVKRLMQAGMAAGGRGSSKLIITPGEVSQDTQVPDGMTLKLEPDVVVRLKGPALNLPDSGTVFEVGYMYAIGKPIVTISFVGSKLNLMLAESVVAHATTLEEGAALMRELLPIFNIPPEGTERNAALLRYAEGKHFKGEIE